MPRSCGGNSCTINASAVANMTAAPTPCTPRARSRNRAVGAWAHASEATVKMTSPIASSRLCPKMSPSEPAVSSTTVRVSVYASTTHVSSANDGIQRLRDVRQRHGHDRHVEQQHERADDDRRERPPLAGARFRREQRHGLAEDLAEPGGLRGQRGPPGDFRGLAGGTLATTVGRARTVRGPRVDRQRQLDHRQADLDPIAADQALVVQSRARR